MPARDRSEAPSGVESLMKALDVIECVARADEPPKVAAIAGRLGLSRPTVYRIVAALVQRSYLRQVPDGQGLRLGHKLFELSYSSWRDLDVAGAAAPIMDGLRDRTGETVLLALRIGPNVVIVERRDSPHDIRPGIPVGHTEPLPRSLFGRAIVAFLPSRERQEILAAGADQWVADPLDPPVAMRVAAARGYAIQTSRFDEQVSGVAAPILDYLGQPFAAIAVIGPARRLPEERLHRLSALVMEAARRITRNAGNPVQSIDPRPRPRGLAELPIAACTEPVALLGESPLWAPEAGRLFWIDIFGPAVFMLDAGTGAVTRRLCQDLPGATFLTPDGSLLVAERGGLVLRSGATLEPLRRLLPFGEELRGRRFNDGVADPAGRLLLGVMDLTVKVDGGEVRRVDPIRGTAETAVPSVTLPNGLRWSPDGSALYLADSRRHVIYRFAADPVTGALGAREIFAHIPPEAGAPDGMAVDAEGCLWVALWDGWSIVRFGPGGELRGQFAVPVPRPTALCFGGPDLSTLYITTASVRLTTDQIEAAPLSGAVLAAVPGVRGLPPPRVPI